MAGLIFIVLALLMSKAPGELAAAFALHEAGHMLAAALCGAARPSFRLVWGGFVLSYPGIRGTPRRLIVSLSGCAVSVALWALLPRGSIIGLYSLGLAAVNLLPVTGLDGGEAFFAVCDAVLSPAAAYRTARAVSVVAALALFAFNCAVQLKYGMNFTLLALTLYLTVSIIGSEA